jgi:hypothetical protein
MRGLDPDNMLEQPDIEASTEERTMREASVAPATHHATRSTRNGRADVNYSQKYHPMDEVTRPKRAQRITGSRSLSTAADETSDDDDEPELYSGDTTGEEEEGDQDEEPDSPVMRIPDPRAVRQSGRTEAKKQVNYNGSHHPQDWALFGPRRSAKRKRQSTPASKPKKRAKKQVFPEKPIVLSSDKTGDSDSDSDGDMDDENGSPVVHLSRSAASLPGEQKEPSGEHHFRSNGSRTASPDGDPVPALPHGESSYNEAEAIVQGERIIQMQRAKQATSNDESASDDRITTEIVNSFQAIIDGVEAPGAACSEPASGDHGNSDESNSQPAPTTISMNLVTPVSPKPMEAANKPCTQAGTQLAIHRPYMATQLTPSTTKELREHAESAGESSSKALAAPKQPTPSSHPSEGPSENGDVSLDASVQPMREVSEDAARVGCAKETTPQLSSDSPSQGQTTSEKRCASVTNVSRQVSRDTLPDDPSSSFFKEAMPDLQDCSQRDCDDEGLQDSSPGPSQLPVSQREHSDACGPEKCPSSDQQRKSDTDDGQHHPSVSDECSGSEQRHNSGIDDGQNRPPSGDVSSSQSRSSDQPIQQQTPSSGTLPGFSAADDAEQQPAADSEDSMLLRPSDM